MEFNQKRSLLHVMMQSNLQYIPQTICGLLVHIQITVEYDAADNKPINPLWLQAYVCCPCQTEKLSHRGSKHDCEVKQKYAALYFTDLQAFDVNIKAQIGTFWWLTYHVVYEEKGKFIATWTALIDLSLPLPDNNASNR